MEKMKDTIHIASLGKRIGAFALDFVLTFALYLTLLYTLGTNVLAESMGSKADTINFYAFATDSKLFEYADESKTSIQVAATSYYVQESSAGNKAPSLYPIYYSSLDYFYNEFCPNDWRIENREGENGIKYSREYFHTIVLGLPDYDSTKNLTKEEITKDESKLYGESKYYRYAVNEATGVVDFSLPATLQSQYEAVIQGNDETAKAELINKLNSYFYGADKSLFVQANQVLTEQPYYQTMSEHSKMTNWAIRLICYLPFSFAFFFLIPVLMKNGQTIGKLAFGTCLVGQDGYRVRPVSKLIRSGVMFLIASIYVIAPISNLYLVFLLFLVCLIDYITMVGARNPNSLALQDRLGKTVVVERKKSEIYENADDEERHLSGESSGDSAVSEANVKEVEVIDIESIKKGREEIFGAEENKKEE